jgi:hypothetical protein
MNQQGDLTRAELYDRLRAQIQHEDELINIRVVWQLLAQSFFFSTYAALLNAPKEAKSAVFAQQQELLLWVVPIVALLAGIIASVSIFTSIYTIEYLGQSYQSYSLLPGREDRSAKLFPNIQGPKAVRAWARIAPVGLPLLFILTWLLILTRVITA